MSIIFMMNIVFINIVVLLLLSVFWSKWTYKLFKPYAWQEDRRKKHILPAVEKIEARFKDRNRFYAVWFLMIMMWLVIWLALVSTVMSLQV